MSKNGQHFVAIIGGAVSGSVAAEILADRGVRVAVIDQNKRPYGKIEDGLPRWHVEQRKQEYERINARLRKPNVSFVPCTRLGREIEFKDLCENWGFSAIILANGAWRDRDLGVPGADKFLGKGLAYQNPFIYWYNHKNEKEYSGAKYETPDEAVVVGGGLASIDVVKVLQIENYQRAMKARGIEASMHELEKGIPAACKAHGIKPEDLGVKGCLLVYRRREQDMPLAQPPDYATPDQIAKTEMVRQKMLKLARDRYLFRFQERRIPLGFAEENGRVVGLQVGETKVEGRKAELIPGSETVIPTTLVVSSIGSVPEKIPGVEMKGDYVTFVDEELPRYAVAHHVFGVGNVVTGQGNIRVSLVHSQKVTNHLIENYLGIGDPNGDISGIYDAAEKKAAGQTQTIEKKVEALPGLSDAQVGALEKRIRELQAKAGYTSDYDSWIAKVTPPDLE
ncbi:MAG TPA: FAD-dependent oxidoreductase [Candidatus Baltobacteraceae bacterium]|nr:FAD-dependent oxidoreductase [Candidatus Baltobacteraceae bacterium]